MWWQRYCLLGSDKNYSYHGRLPMSRHWLCITSLRSRCITLLRSGRCITLLMNRHRIVSRLLHNVLTL